MDNIKRLNAITLQIVLASFICTLYSFIYPTGGYERSFYPLILLLAAPIYLVTNELFLRRERGIRATIFFNLLIVLLTTIIIAIIERENFLFTQTVVTPALILTLFAFLSIRLVTKPLTEKVPLHAFDISTVIFLITIFYISNHNYPISFSYISLFALAFSFFSLIVSKQKSSGTNRNWLSTLLCAIIAIALMWLMSRYAYFAGEGLVQIWSSILLFFERIMLFIKWLFSQIPSIFPEANESLVPAIIEEGQKRREIITPEINPVIFVVIVIVIAVVAELILLFHFLKGAKLNAKKKIRNKEVIAYSKTSLLDGLKNAFRNLRLKIKAKIYITKNKNNSVGLYFWIINVLKKDIWRKNISQTPRTFIINLEEKLKKQGMDISLSPMVEEVERYFYSQNPIALVPYKDSKNIRKEIKRIVLIRRYKDFLTDIKESCKRLFYRKKAIDSQKEKQIFAP